jgi:hypothetical protein
MKKLEFNIIQSEEHKTVKAVIIADNIRLVMPHVDEDGEEDGYTLVYFGPGDAIVVAHTFEEVVSKI